MRHRAFALIALLLAPLPAAAESVDRKAPPVGMNAAYDIDFMRQSVPVTQEIVAVNGDEQGAGDGARSAHCLRLDRRGDGLRGSERAASR